MLNKRFFTNYGWVIIALVILLIFSKKIAEFIKAIFGKIPIVGEAFQDSEQVVKSESHLNQVENTISKSGLTLTASSISQIAIDLYNAMNQKGSFGLADWDGTNESVIYKSFDRIKTADDMRAVFVAFGVREYTSWFGIVTRSAGNLKYWLEMELSDSEFSKIKPKLDLI